LHVPKVPLLAEKIAKSYGTEVRLRYIFSRYSDVSFNHSFEESVKRCTGIYYWIQPIQASENLMGNVMILEICAKRASSQAYNRCHALLWNGPDKIEKDKPEYYSG